MSRGPARAKRRIVSLGAIALIAAAGGITALHTSEGRSLEGQSIDARFAIRGREQPDPRVALVEIDAASMNQLGYYGRFPRARVGALIDTLHRDGARAIGVDLVFETPGPGSRALIQSARSAGNVVFASSATDGRIGNALCWGSGCHLRAAHATTGDSQLPVDDGGVFRRMPFSVGGIPSLAVALVNSGTRSKVSPFAWQRTLIDFAGPGGAYAHYSALQVLRGHLSSRVFRGRIVLIGLTDPAAGDLHPTPVDAAMPGVEIQANAVATLLAGRPLQSAPGWVGLLLVLAAALLAPALGLRARPAWILAGVVVAGAAAAASDQIAFDHGLVLPAVAPLLSLAIAGAGTVCLGYLAEARARALTRDRFQRFVPAEVVDDVLARAGDNLELGGEFIEATILFADLRGFTTFSESRPAAEVIDALNRYLSEMTEAILAHGGTLVTYMGDGIDAVFGAPISMPDHADRALAAAREMLDIRLPKVNAELRERGVAEQFRMGIGINSGEVMSGTVGSAQRLKYAVIGDATNTAARIEELTKTVGEPLLFSDATRTLLTRPADGIVEAGEHPIRGRTETVRLWTLRELQPELRPNAREAPVPEPL